jgi:sterol desaturase/sphingolipid hydroxylase (fatty acid hydroxylase superfamily)
MNLIIIEGIILLASIFHHSNINLFHRAEKILSYIIVTPSIHWVHHHAKQTNTDSNYSTIFSWWDRLFYTRSSMLRFIGMIIGVEGDKEQTLFTLIRRPFIKK